ncbi:hypothetical protein SB397_20335 [Burkholderia multivorans]|uniref:hypothetical protein n=1 Tax=Burkholderia multivorans TaxID=87883 RepID=UPI002B24009C|nr:hypothetical protein [Burkholderia multivorans]MEB2487935.1 hypothetical protein [Burkholderia multivorans]MEB2570054.1 hypothetical protein [Burkholderia multivorans]
MSTAAARPLRPRNPALANFPESRDETYPSPVEFLIVFAVVFGAGVLTSVGLRQYVDKIRREAADRA